MDHISIVVSDGSSKDSLDKVGIGGMRRVTAFLGAVVAFVLVFSVVVAAAVFVVVVGVVSVVAVVAAAVLAAAAAAV